jgi:hypothetical protein
MSTLDPTIEAAYHPPPPHHSLLHSLPHSLLLLHPLPHSLPPPPRPTTKNPNGPAACLEQL